MKGGDEAVFRMRGMKVRSSGEEGGGEGCGAVGERRGWWVGGCKIGWDGMWR